MKSIKILFATSIIVIVSFTGCKKFVDVNNDPNNNQNTRADYIFSGALGNSYRNQVTTNTHIIPATWTGIYAHSTSFTGGGNEKTYEYTPADFNAFSGLFDNIADYDYVLKNADKEGLSYLKGPANVMQCYMYQMLVDLYGNVPYETAFQGTNNITPAYKDQKAIYEDLIVRLDAAMDKMNAETWPILLENTQQDVLFQLNRAKWIQFANTLKLRILMRQSFMGGTRDAYIQTNALSRASFGFLNENALMSPGYVNIAGKLNPFYANFGYNEINNVQSNYQYRKMNSVLINFLKNSNGVADTFRLQSLAYPIGSTFNNSTTAAFSITSGTATVAGYIGVNMGIGSGFATDQSSPIGPIAVQSPFSTRPGTLMLAAESFLLQAEFAQKFGLTVGGQTAENLYRAGVLAHYRTCAAPATAGNVANAGDAFANRYLARPVNNVNFTLSTDKIRAILLQKWISLTHVNGLEQWSEYRKASGTSSVGVPSSVRTFASTTNPEPVRYLYPQGEFDNNANNVPSGINRFTSKIFWDVN
jgi:Starch-binding associating with outer membrane